VPTQYIQSENEEITSNRFIKKTIAEFNLNLSSMQKTVNNLFLKIIINSTLRFSLGGKLNEGRRAHPGLWPTKLVRTYYSISFFVLSRQLELRVRLGSRTLFVVRVG
jgi:hypothetical protein